MTKVSFPKFIESIDKAFDAERAQYPNMTLGQFIAALEGFSEGARVRLGNMHSYRGYHSDLAFERVNNCVGLLLSRGRAAVGKTFRGYRGGEYTMGEETLLWVAKRGITGLALIDLQLTKKGNVEVVVKDVEG